MRVAIVQEFLDPRRGGAETSVLEMARQLARLKLAVTILSRDNPPVERPPQDSPADVMELRIVQVPTHAVTRAGATAQFIAAVDDLRPNFDVVHAVTPCRTATVYQPRGGTYAETIKRGLAIAPPGLGRSLRRLGRGFNRRQKMLSRVESVLLSRRDPPCVAAVSAYVRRQILAGSPAYPPERVQVVFNGVDIDPLPLEQARRQRAAIRAKLEIGAAPLVLFVAHNFKLKGLRELIRAMATQPARECGFVVAVAGRDGPAPYRRLAARTGVSGRVRFVGSGTPVRALYSAADLLAHPTWYDPCSRVVLEALGCGLPVVTTRYNGAAEAIDPGNTGAVIDDPGYAEDLAAAISACAEPGMHATCRDASAANRDRLSMARHARDLLALYQSKA